MVKPKTKVLNDLQLSIIDLVIQGRDIKEIATELKIGMWRVRENLKIEHVKKELRTKLKAMEVSDGQA